jgi:hypothetical protein
MKIRIPAICYLLSAIFDLAFAQGTAFTYQGRLNAGSNPAGGIYDLRFTIYDSAGAGTLIAGPLTNSATAVSNGLFIVTLDFGARVFSGANYWLEIGVRTNGNGGFTALAPRQPLTPTPYAIYAGSASNLAGNISSANLTGNYTNAVTFNNGSDEFYGTFSGQFFGPLFIGGSFSGAHFGDGGGLFNLNASQLGGGIVPDARLAGNVARTNQVWLLNGNGGTTAGVNFVGTTDNQPLELHVNGQRALRLVPDTSTNTSPDVIGGSPVNAVAPGLVGVTIGGGGATVYAGLPGTNVVLGNFNTIAGGWGNTTGSTNFNVSEATIAGGAQNTASGISSFIGGGAFNLAYGNNATVAGGLQNRANYHSFVGSGFANSADGLEATIGSGRINTVQTNTVFAVIGGGYDNTIQGNNNEGAGTIGGGGLNTIQPSSVLDGRNPFGNSSFSTIGGGYQNQIQSNTVYSTVGGGLQNVNSATYGTVGGGVQNRAGANTTTIGGGYLNVNTGPISTIGGGWGNTIGDGADNSIIAGGINNTIIGSDVLSVMCTIGGGSANLIQTNTSFATISGGIVNQIQPGAHEAVVGGGTNNIIQTNAANSVIAGGINNLIQTPASTATIGGGNQNQVSAANAVIGGGSGNLVLGGGAFSTIGGGVNNTNFGPFATIAGGVNNLAGANAFAAGSGAQAGNQGSFVWADATGAGLSSTNNNSVTFRAAGGYRLYSNAGATLGVFLAANGNSWSSISDRNAKKNIQPVNYEAILDKLAQVPVRQWNYKSESDGDTPNLGPMAQDFKAAFYPGRDDKSISTLEFDGVELAAIMGLNRKLDEKDTEIHALKQRNEMLEKRLDNLEQMVELITDKN